MFPIRDDNPQLRRPYATILLIAINALVWLLMQAAGSEPGLSRSICQLGLIPADLLGLVPAGTSLDFGGGVRCVIAESGSWYTLLSHMFTHGSWFHLIGNLWFLWVFGDNVEDAMGSLRFVVFYLLCGFAAAAAQIAAGAASTIPMVGASGAIGGVMGAYILLYPRVRVHMLLFLGFFVTTFAVPAVLMLGYWFLIQLLSGLGSLGRSGGGVAFWAHAGGFAAGAVLIWLFRRRSYIEAHPYHGWTPSSKKSFRRIR